MNLSDKLTQKALDYLNSFEAFAKEEIPSYINELLQYHFFDNIASICLETVIIIIIIASARAYYFKFYKTDKYDEYNNLHEVSAILMSIATPLLILLFSILIFENIKLCIKIKMVPRVYLVDHIQH